MTENPYDPIASYYDLSHAALKEDIPFLLSLITRSEGNILELGCGSGRLLIPFALAGRKVTGIDSSAAMLDLGRKKIQRLPLNFQQNIQLIHGGMVNFRLPDRFTDIVFSHNTLMHLIERELNDCLHTVRQHLTPDGELIIDLINPLTLLDLEEQEEPVWEQTLVDPLTGNKIEQWGQYRLNLEKQILQLTYIYKPRRGEPVSTTTYYHIRHPHQIQLACQQANLKVLSLWGDYDRRPFTEESERLILVASPY